MRPPSPPRLRIQRRDYRDPHTGLGYVLTEAATLAASEFIVHECGCLKYVDWNHRGILSPYWRLHYNFSPGNSLACAGERFELGPDALVLTPAGVSFDTFGPKSPLHTWIHFSPTRSFHLTFRRPIRVPRSAAHCALYADLADRFTQPASPEIRVQLLHLCQALLHATFARLESAHFQHYPENLQSLLSFLETNPQQDLSNRELANRVGMSLPRFIPWFKAHVAETPARYVQKLRLRLAAAKLCLSEASIDQIASEAGFANRFHFSRLFRSETGQAPAAYRKRHRSPA